MPSPTREEIKAARAALGLTQEEAGAIVDSSRKAWQAWELGTRNMPELKWKVFNRETKAK